MKCNCTICAAHNIQLLTLIIDLCITIDDDRFIHVFNPFFLHLLRLFHFIVDLVAMIAWKMFLKSHWKTQASSIGNDFDVLMWCWVIGWRWWHRTQYCYFTWFELVSKTCWWYCWFAKWNQLPSNGNATNKWVFNVKKWRWFLFNCSSYSVSLHIRCWWWWDRFNDLHSNCRLKMCEIVTLT